MKKIAVLDQHTIDKIAAGEVVERPASVVKELVENAIDAGATAVTVEIKDGGKTLIRITDNGSGMEADQVPLAFLRHATSKIEKVEDLAHIVSLGFRGEALSSIAAVSQVELITKTPTAVGGVRYRIEGGKELSLEEIGAPEGTTFLVRNLFYNTPARSKFLRSDMTEGNYISALMEQLALTHPEISFKYIQNRQVKLHTSGNYRVRDVIYGIYGKDITRSLLEASYENDFLKITGFVGKPEIARGNRSFENYDINGRYVKNKIITKAVEDAYKGFLMQHKFPFVSLHIEMEGNDLDVNVHPAKMEVRFARGPEVYDAVFEAVRRALTAREMIPEVPLDPAEKTRPAQLPGRGDVPEPFETKRRQEPLQEAFRSPAFTGEEERLFRGTLRSGPGPKKEQPDHAAEETAPFGGQEMKRQPSGIQEMKPELSAHSEIHQEVKREPSALSGIQEVKPAPPAQMELFGERLLAPESRSRHRLIGQIFDTYWLVTFGDNFYIIDQHAAHEKVYYERFVRQLGERAADSQYLSPPLIVTLNPQEEVLLQANLALFAEAGFEIEPFGGREYAVSAVPAELYGFTETELFLEMLDHLADEGMKNARELFTARLATMACKAAVKGNHAMSAQEADALIDELLKLEDPYHCPHGRPTIIAMTKTELEKKFHRIV